MKKNKKLNPLVILFFVLLFIYALRLCIQIERFEEMDVMTFSADTLDGTDKEDSFFREWFNDGGELL